MLTQKTFRVCVALMLVSNQVVLAGGDPVLDNKAGITPVKAIQDVNIEVAKRPAAKTMGIDDSVISVAQESHGPIAMHHSMDFEALEKADLNDDYVIDLDDYNRAKEMINGVRQSFGSDNAAYDFNQDGRVNLDDLNEARNITGLIQSHFGTDFKDELLEALKHEASELIDETIHQIEDYVLNLTGFLEGEVADTERHFNEIIQALSEDLDEASRRFRGAFFLIGDEDIRDELRDKAYEIEDEFWNSVSELERQYLLDKNQVFPNFLYPGYVDIHVIKDTTNRYLGSLQNGITVLTHTKSTLDQVQSIGALKDMIHGLREEKNSIEPWITEYLDLAHEFFNRWQGYVSGYEDALDRRVRRWEDIARRAERNI